MKKKKRRKESGAPLECQLEKELKELLENTFNEDSLPPASSPPTTGVIMEKCPHCGGLVDYTKGGVRLKKCTKCGRLIEPRLFR